MNKAFYQFFLFFAGSFVCLYLAFSPTVNTPYADHDSIRYFHKFFNKASEAVSHPQYGFLKADGRIVTAELEELIYKNINHLSDVSRLRLCVIIVLALGASLLTCLAQAAGMGALSAFCLCTSMFTLPGIQNLVFVPYTSMALAVSFSLLAYVVSLKELKFAAQLAGVFVLLETSFFLYPPSTFFFSQRH